MHLKEVENICEISKLIRNLQSEADVCVFFSEIFTPAELTDLSKRWRILQELHAGKTQRDIANNLQVSLCKVTRGSKILKNNNAITTKYFKQK